MSRRIDSSAKRSKQFEVHRSFTTVAACFDVKADFLVVCQACKARSLDC